MLPKDFVFGKISEDDHYKLEDLIKDPDCPPCLLKRDFNKWMKTLNKLRYNLKKRDSTRFSLRQFYEKLAYYDKVSVIIISFNVYDAKCLFHPYIRG